MNDEFMTFKEVKALLKISNGTLRTLIEKGLPHFRVGVDYRFRRKDVEAWAAAQIEKSAQNKLGNK
jgi:excisionase family DNA binding protein